MRYARSRAKKDGGGAGGTGQNRKKKAEKTDGPEKLNQHHVVGGNGSSNGAEVKREMRTKNRDASGGTMTPPLATIAAAGGSPGYASTIMRRSFGSGSEYGAPGTSPSGSISGSEGGQHGHAHYAALAAGAAGRVDAGTGPRTENGSALTPSPSPPASTSASVPSTSASGSLALPTPGASSSSVITATGHSTLTSVSTLPQAESNQDNNFIHYHPPSQHHDRMVPPLSVHSHSYPHSHSHPSHASHPHSPHPAFSTHPSSIGVGSAGQYAHTGYTARPSPLSQAGNIVTGPAAGPLTPLSVPHSATEDTDENGTGAGGGTQLPPLAYMDRLVGSNSNNGHNHTMHSAPPLGPVGVKMEYGDGQAQGSGGGGNIEVGGGGTSVGREPLTPLSAESPIGPGVGGRNGRRLVLGGQ